MQLTRGAVTNHRALLYCTFVLSKVQNPERKPGNNVLLFPGFVLSKVKKTITFSITFSMLGAPGVYLLYFLSYLGCVGRMVSGFCTILLVRVPPYSSSCWSATTKTVHRVRVETTCRHLRLETLPLSTRCTFVIFVGAFVAVL
jgi:hypothetical protein